MPSTPGALAIGAKVGSYEVIAPLGSGGMGEVYRARDSKLSRDVALKVLPAALASDPERLSRFRREAQVLAALNHPNIAQIYGLEDAGAVHALVMELVPGRTLDEIIASHGAGAAKGMPVADALPIARQIAEALETAHEQGIIHRDLKPANVKVREDGTVKVLDFGLAKAIDPGASAQADPTNSPTLTAGSTQLGVILGTAAYMAPEQARGRVVDRRADIWAFGVVLYEMLTGDRAFKGEDISETLASVLKDTPQFDALPSDLPPRLRRLIADCLVRDPRQRLRDIGDARLIIDKIISGKDEEVVASGISPVARPRSRFATLAPWGIAVAALLVAAFVLWSSSHAPAEPPRVVTRSLQELKELSGFVAISRDGTRAVFTVAGPGGYFLIRRDMSEFEGQRIPGSENALFPVLSPDGQSVAYGAANESNLKKIPVSGGTAITLCQGSFVAGGAWGDDDTIVFSGSNGLFQVPSTGGTAQQLTTVDTAQGEGAHIRPQFLPGGRELLFTVTRAKVTETPQFAILDLKTRKYSLIAPGGDNGRYAPTGHLTYVRTGTLFALPFDLAHRSVIGLEAPVVPNVSSVGPAGTGDYAFSDNGVLVYSQVMFGAGSTLTWAGRDGTTTAMPGQIGRDWGTGRLSLDGTRVVNGIHAEKGRTDIWIIDLLRGTPTRLTFEGNYDNPIWMPDGRTVVFGSLDPPSYGLYRTTVNGSGKVERLVATERRSIPFAATPDGNIVVFSEFVSEAKSRLFVLPPAGADGSRHPEPLHETSSDETQAELSPDGKWIAYRSSETRSNEIYVHAFPKGDKVRISTNGGNRPRWAKQGRELLYWDNVIGNPVLTSVMIQTAPAFQPSMPKPLFQLAVGTTWDVAPGGEKFLVEFLAPPPGAGGNKSRIATVTNWFDELRLRAPAKKK